MPDYIKEMVFVLLYAHGSEISLKSKRGLQVTHLWSLMRCIAIEINIFYYC